MEAEWVNRGGKNDQLDAQVDNEVRAERAWYQPEIQSLRQAAMAVPPSAPPPPPGGPPGGQSGNGAGEGVRDAHKVDAPSLGTIGSMSMPAAREYSVWKDKVQLYLDMTQYPQVVALSKPLMKMAGRVAEYVLLTYPLVQRHREDAVAELR